jgi:uncharacterized protein YbjT (DUF2867 family)
MNTQDMARFAVAALERPQTVRQAFPVVGPRAWTTGEITQLCERYTGKDARLFRVPPTLLQLMRGVTSFFEASLNVAERLTFDRVIGGGTGLDPADTTSLEDYLREYYDTILKRLREMEADLDKDAKKKLPF